MAQSKEYGSVPALNSEDVVITTAGEYNGVNYVDIRQYYHNDADELRPGKKGVRVAPEDVAKMIVSLAKAIDDRLGVVISDIVGAFEKENQSK